LRTVRKSTRNCVVVFFILTNSAFGQKIVKEFFTRDGKETDEASSYYYSLGIKKEFLNLNAKIPVESYVDTMRTYYSRSKKIRSITLYTSDGVMQGGFFAFHENGSIKEKGLHSNDRKVGNFISWYDNGKLHKTIKYSEKPRGI
jgi:antitoxin component YwqK of YwqJK toxin-antitoxin module